MFILSFQFFNFFFFVQAKKAAMVIIVVSLTSTAYLYSSFIEMIVLNNLLSRFTRLRQAQTDNQII
jgi:hypothetical protein